MFISTFSLTPRHVRCAVSMQVLRLQVGVSQSFLQMKELTCGGPHLKQNLQVLWIKQTFSKTLISKSFSSLASLWKHNSSCNLVLKPLHEQCRHRVSGFRALGTCLNMSNCPPTANHPSKQSNMSRKKFCWSCSKVVVPKWPRTV